MALDRLIAARADALFASDLSIQCGPTEDVVETAIRTAVRTHGGVRGCLGEVGAAYGEHPETAVARMRWALRVIDAIYCRPRRPAAAAHSPERIDERNAA